MRRAWLAVLLATTACSSPKSGGSPEPAAAPSGSPRPLPSPLPRVAATVNGQPILSSLVTLFLKKTRGAVAIDERPAAYRKALEQCIDRELLFEDALSRGLIPDDRAVQRAFDEAHVKHPDDQSWNAFLREQALTADGFRAEIRTEQTVAALLRQEASKISEVDDQEAHAYYDANPSVFDSGPRVRARRILIAVSPGTSKAGRDLIRSANAMHVLKRLKAGEDFATVASEVSSDPKAGKGGELGVVSRVQLPNEVEQQVFHLEPGQLSDVLEIPEGFEIIQVEEKLPGEKLTFEQAEPRLKGLLWAQKRDRALQDLLKTLRGKASVETFL
jgi:parvulin-like peptidyl-prolyl isomerase